MGSRAFVASGVFSPLRPEEDGPADPQHPFAVSGLRRYARDGIIGIGAMGRVLKAWDRRLRRFVAVKEIAPGAAGAGPERLTREAWIAARLEHPGIVPVYDAGVGPEGELFYAMRLVRGRSLQEALEDADGRPGRMALLRHFLGACEAVAYAHSVGVIHRDLKPANIMVGPFGETQVVDWGLARPIRDDDLFGEEDDPDGDAAAHLTQVGAVVGTPSYMSPEQARGEITGPASDVWSLGSVLYALIAGAPPYHGSSSAEVFSALLSSPPPPLAPSPPDVPAPLIAIVERAMAREPADRYPDAGALSEDLQRFLDGRWVQAYSYTPMDLLVRAIKAWRAPLIVAAVGMALISGVAAVGYYRTSEGLARATRAEASTREALKEAGRNLQAVLVSRSQIAQAEGHQATAEILAAHALLTGPSPGARGVLAAFGAGARPTLEARDALPDCQARFVSPTGLSLLCVRGDTLTLFDGAALSPRWTVPQRVAWATALEGVHKVAIMDDEARVGILDGATGEALLWVDGLRGPFQLTASPDGRYVANHTADAYALIDTATGDRLERTGCGGDITHLLITYLPGDRIATLCATGRLAIGPLLGPPDLVVPSVLPFDHPGISAMAASPDGRQLLLGGLRGGLFTVDTATGALLDTYQGDTGSIASLSYSPDGGLAAVVGVRSGLRLWQPSIGALVGALPVEGGPALSWSGRTLTTWASDRRAWRLPADLQPTRFTAAPGVSTAQISPAGDELATTYGDGTVRVWSLLTGAPVKTLSWQGQVVKAGAYSPDGRFFVAGAVGAQGMWVFDTADWREARILRIGTSIFRRVGVMAGGLAWGLTYSSTPPHVFQLDTGEDLGPIELEAAQYPDGDTAPDGSAAVAVNHLGNLWTWRAEDPTHARLVAHDEDAVRVAIGPRGEVIAVGHRSDVTLLDAATGAPMGALDLGDARILDLAFSPDGQRMAIGTLSGEAEVWDLARRERLALLTGHKDRVADVRFDTTGRWLLTGGWDGAVYRWDLGGLERPAEEVVTEVEAAWGQGLREALGEQGL